MKSPVQAYRVEAELKLNGTLTLNDLPFRAGERVDVIVITQAGADLSDPEYSLRGLPITYDRPFDSVDSEDWNASV